jgi:hypothetical protein
VRLHRRAVPLSVRPHSHMLRKCMGTFAVVVLSILGHALVYEWTAHLLSYNNFQSIITERKRKNCSFSISDAALLKKYNSINLLEEEIHE